MANFVTSWTEPYETEAIEGGGTEETTYYYANNELIAKKTPSDDLIFYHNDYLHSTSVLTDDSGNIVEETKYDPWGKIVEGATMSKFAYTGQEHDAETGLNYYNARYYNPDIMHFTQPDPFVQNIYDPQTLNRYAYVRNNPLKYTDPSGHCWSGFGFICGLFSNSSGPAPASTAKLPNNIPNTSVSLPNNKGSNPIVYGKETTITNYVNKVADDGHVSVEVSKTLGPSKLLSVGGGMNFDKNGSSQFISGNGSVDLVDVKSVFGKKGLRVGATIMFSTDHVKERNLSYNATVALGVAAQFSYDPADVFNIKKWDFEKWGVGCCGADFGPEWTGRIAPYPQPIPDVRSKDLNEIYGR